MKTWCMPIVAWAVLLAMPALAQGPADPHRAEDRAKHEKIAVAHEAAAQCLRASNADREGCHKQLQADCRGLAVGTHCGLRRKPGEYKDKAAHLAEHERMAAVHQAAAQCLAGARPYKECQAELSRSCGGLGVGRYCGMRHAH